ncbi:MAG: DUF6279 family lipoprotein [Pseudomonadota bacterium]
MRLFLLGLAAAPLLAGCGALRLGYGNGPQLAWWWLDGYLDVTSAHAPAVKSAIARWFDWHRASELPKTVAFLGGVAAQMTEPTTPAQAAHLGEQARALADPALDRALLLGAEVLPGLGEAQLRHLEQRYAKNLEELRSEFAQADPTERRRAAEKRATERFERVYGRLNEAQQRLVAEGLAASPFDPELWLAERRARQRDTVATLRRLLAERADADARTAALRMLAERGTASPDPAYRARQQRLVEHNCALTARVHNAATPAQRARARDTLRGWADDLRSLLETAGGPGASS